MRRLIYLALGIPILRFALWLLSFRNEKIATGLRLRAKLADGRAPWLDFPQGTRPIWIHCASGEFEYAKPVITQLKTQRPETRILVTYFSPSVRDAVARFPGVDFACPSPWEDPEDLATFIEHHQPRALLIARTDVWPEMTYQARHHGVPSLLFSATLTAKSGRSRFWARIFTRWSLSQVDAIYCASEADREAFRALGLTMPIEVGGDTRFDQAMARLRNPKPIKHELFGVGRAGGLKRDFERPVFVAGSTWSEDETVLIDVIAKMRDRMLNKIRFVIVPHEPTPEHVREIESRLQTAGLASSRYSQITDWPDGHVLIVDQVGILAEVYAHATFAFVGGSFRKTVHSVMEPLAAGCLTFVGPLHANNREALEFATLPVTGSERLKMVTVLRDVREWTELLAHAVTLNLDTPNEAIRSEVEKRSGRTKLVLAWLDARIYSPSREG